MSMNVGHFHKEDYVKFINFEKAVYWKEKEMSLQTYVINKILADGIPLIRFIDLRQHREWLFKTDAVMKDGLTRQVGPEEQFYFSLRLATVRDLPADKGTTLPVAAKEELDRIKGQASEMQSILKQECTKEVR